MGDEMISQKRQIRYWPFVVALFMIAALIFVSGSSAEAKDGAYPSKPVRVIVGFPPGGGVDVVARLLAQKLDGVLGQPVVVENKPGAASGIATRFVAGSEPNGYTVLINSNSMVVNQVINPNAGYDILRQLMPITNVAWQSTIIVAKPDLKVSSLKDVLELSRKRKVSYGTPGTGSVLHLAGTYLFNMLAKVNLLHVPYKGASPALTAAAGNQVDLAFTTLPPAVPLVKSGKIKAIAVTSLKRSPALPDTPTVAESGFPGYEVRVFTGYFMPAKTPKAVGDKFGQAVRKVLAMPEIKERLAKLGFEQADPSENFQRLVSDELKMWAKVAKEANIKIQ